MAVNTCHECEEDFEGIMEAFLKHRSEGRVVSK